MKLKDLVLGTLVGRQLVLQNGSISEMNSGTFQSVIDDKVYPTIVAVRTEPFGKAEGSYVVMLTLEWNNNQFDFMCSNLMALLSLELKD